jgi:recombination protein RecT
MTAAIEKKESAPLTPVDRQMMSLMSEFEKRATRLEHLLPPGSSVERFTEGIRFALAQTPALLKCTPGSIMVACMKAAKLGIDVSGGALGHGHLVPFGTECTFVPGYKGLVALAVASGVVKDMTPVLVYSADEFELEEGEVPRFVHKPFVPRKNGEARGDIIAAYTRVVLDDGTRVVKGMLFLDDIERIEGGIRAGQSPWKTPHRPEMVKKSTVKNAFKTLGVPEGEKTVALRRAMEADAEAELVDITTKETPQARTSPVDIVKARLKSKVLPDRVTLEASPTQEPEHASMEPTDEQIEAERAARALRQPGEEG